MNDPMNMSVVYKVETIPLTMLLSIEIALGLCFKCAFFLLLPFNAGVYQLAIYTRGVNEPSFSSQVEPVRFWTIFRN